MTAAIYTNCLAALLLLFALFQLFLPSQTARSMSKPTLIRLIGAALLLLSIPCLWWRGWYFRTLFAALVLSGVWRLFFPHHSIRAQERSYLRWVHGCLLLGAAIAVWVLPP